MGAKVSLPDVPPDQSPLAKKMSSVAKYWISGKGRNTMGGIAALCVSGYFVGYVALHTWFLPNYRDAVQLYKNGFLTPLTPEVFDRANVALADLKMNEKQRQTVKFFSVYGMDMFYAGSTRMVGGAQIGIPRNFIYKTTNDVERHDIIVDMKNVEWGTEGGQMLMEALVLSENAQKFGIARDICMADAHYVYMHGGLGSFTGLLYYFLSRNANDVLLGLYKPRSFRILVYSAVGLFCFGIWAVSTDLLTKYYENRADKRVGHLNLNYARGGVEFYAKILQRNMALRSLLGPKGEKMYTFFGNDVEFIRERHVPFTKRKSNLEKAAEKLSLGGNNNTNKSNGGGNLSSEDPHLLKS